jgi:hypothetical protein
LPLDLTQLLSHDAWAAARVSHAGKERNAHYIKQFNDAVMRLSPAFATGTIRYYSNTPARGRYLSYGEGTPIFSLFKLVPGQYSLNSFTDTYWVNYRADDSIFSKLQSYSHHKYSVNNTVPEIDPPYILYPLAYKSIELSIVVRCAAWANSNKRTIVFKKHPYVNPAEWDVVFNHLYSKGLSGEYVKLVEDVSIDSLINSCIALWCGNSGTAVTALLQGKPVAYFTDDIDCAFGPLATKVSSPEQAVEVCARSKRETVQYFTWYYENVGVDLLDSSFEQQLEHRLHKYFK